MRFVLLIFVILLCSIPFVAQVADAKLPSDLEALHAKWFKAFDSGDGATMAHWIHMDEDGAESERAAEAQPGDRAYVK